jgi:hypothetical protein
MVDVGKKVAGLLIIGTMAGMLAACEQEGPAEELGEAVDETSEDVGEAMEDAGEEAQDAAN